ncbi:uncharacterized protein LOC125594716 [Brassica napus]|uniref:uncharacterized protein LOC125594716 n=1 Tax=Brassica napus TaxID=3708 RepID=UPI00207913E0|nr:uncharacterized protein LOC125594716 [Brassica napus]
MADLLNGRKQSLRGGGFRRFSAVANGGDKLGEISTCGHVEGTAVPDDDNDVLWRKRDGLVKLWIYGTLAPPLFKSSFKTGGTARDVWLRIENQFRNNKESRAIQLDNDLRTKEIGNQTVREFSQELKSIADLLENVDAPVSDKTLVMYMLNGLNEKFDHIINVIKHQKPYPTFEEARNMLELEETRLKKSTKVTASHKTMPLPLRRL